MTYNQFDKIAYVSICQRYNAVRAKLEAREDNAEFIALSLQLHTAKAYVPKRWGWPGFIKNCGTGGF